MNLRKLSLFLLIIPFSISFIFAYNINTETFKSEFNKPDEVCDVSYNFIYVSSEMKITNSVTYACCNNKNICTFIAFDTYNLKPYRLIDLREIYTIDYIQQKIKDGEIDKDLYSVDNGFSSCEYLGYRTKLEEESINLGALVAKKSETYLSKNSQNMMKTVIYAGEKLGKVRKFNPGDFAVGVSCNYVNDKIETSYNKLALCDNFLKNIFTGNAYFGISKDLSSCNKEVLLELKTNLESLDVVFMGAVDQIGSGISSVIDYFSKLRDNPGEIPKFEVKDTNYQILQDVEKKLDNDNVNFTYHRADELANKNYIRIQDMYNETSTNFKIKEIEFKNLNKKFFVEIFLINLFKEPNYNTTKIDTYYNASKAQLKLAEELIEKYQFNSANIVLEKLGKNIEKTNELIENESNTERKIDFVAIFYIITGILVSIFIIIAIR